MTLKNKKKLGTLVSLSLLAFTTLNVSSHDGHGNQGPWKACEEKSLAQSCSYEGHNALYKGSCRSMNNILMCVRNQPIEKLTNNTIVIQSTNDNITKKSSH